MSFALPLVEKLLTKNIKKSRGRAPQVKHGVLNNTPLVSLLILHE